MRKVLLSALLVLLTSAISISAQEARKIKIGVEGAYPPFSQIGTDGKLKGFDIDIAYALCEQMKAQCTLVQQEFDGMIPSLQARKIDAVIASMSITEERQKVVDFTDKYYRTPARFVARKTSGLTVTAMEHARRMFLKICMMSLFTKKTGMMQQLSCPVRGNVEGREVPPGTGQRIAEDRLEND